MAKIAYARVSSTGQSLVVQQEKLAFCDLIFEEKKSGQDSTRPQLAECLKYLRKGDTLYVTRLDRLARSTLHLAKIFEDLKQRGIELAFTDQSLDTSSPVGKLLFDVLAAISEFETELRKERQRDGITKALKNGVQFGAKAKLTPEQVAQMIKDKEVGMSVKDLCTKYGLGPASVHRIVKAEKVKAEPFDWGNT